jgi:pimeloyl-ACP methyl ester carboxylesterase
MTASLVLLWAVAHPAVPVETKWAQVAPVVRQSGSFERSPHRHRAVVLVQGLRPHPFSNRNVTKADWHGWQKAGSRLVKALATDADVFAFAYGQNVAVDRIAGADCLGDNVRRLKRLGYAEIVLVGYSAGGLVARHFVEDHPDAGVTKVVQVCAPNGGSGWAEARALLRKGQREFLASLAKHGRQQCLARRAGKKIPESVEFVCVVGHLGLDVSVMASLEVEEGRVVHLAAAVSAQGDGMVSSGCQWTAELQDQGIPVVPMEIGHFRVMRARAGVETIARLVRDRQPRWNAGQVAEARRKLFGAEPALP